MGRLDVDMTTRLSRKDEAVQLAEAQERLLYLRLTLGGQIGGRIGPPLCVVFEGWDASGKGGAIKRLVDHLDPRHVRVSQFAAPTYDEIVGFQTTLAAEGMILVKPWMHVTPEEQAHRFERRRHAPLKACRLTDEDWRSREKRKQHERALEDMIARTDHPAAPWQVIAAEDKRWARVEVVRRVCHAIGAAGIAEPKDP